MTKETEDIKKHVLKVAEITIESEKGLAGDWLTWEPDAALVEVDHDIGGNPIRRAMYNTSITLTVTLSIGSESIGFLNNMAVSRLSAPVTFTDSTTDTEFTCAECAINAVGGVLSSNGVRSVAFTIKMIKAGITRSGLKEVVV
jgi:hypothetical protein